jgi:hypothetical protein
MTKHIFEIKFGYVTNNTAETNVKITFVATLHHVKW